MSRFIGVLDQGNLEATLARPLTVVFHYEPFPTPALKELRPRQPEPRS
ncbi:hypothetical protein TPY_1578 [Sulfobacillus acidophilus TPY]|nr:hypothetical protein TPY_1578 [Sulfobacillus acidophilus TPY]